MGGFSIWHILIFAIILLLLFGGNRFSSMMGDVAPWSIFFVEDVTPGLCSSTPLLDRHLIIRARQKTNGKDDLTIKFRPAAPIAAH